MSDNTPTRKLSLKNRKGKSTAMTESNAAFSSGKPSTSHQKESENSPAIETSTPIINREQWEKRQTIEHEYSPIFNTSTQELEFGWDSPQGVKNTLKTKSLVNKGPSVSPIGAREPFPRNLFSKQRSFGSIKNIFFQNEINSGVPKPEEQLRLLEESIKAQQLAEAKLKEAQNGANDSMEDIFNSSEILRSTQAIEKEAYENLQHKRPHKTTFSPNKPMKRTTFQLGCPISKLICHDKDPVDSKVVPQVQSDKDFESVMQWMDVETMNMPSQNANIDEEDFVKWCNEDLSEAMLEDTIQFEEKKHQLPSTQDFLKQSVPKATDEWPDDDLFADDNVLQILTQAEAQATQKLPRTEVKTTKVKKCSAEEIARKRQLAIERRKNKSKYKPLC